MGSYTHAGGLSLSWDQLYTHDAACPTWVPLVPNCPPKKIYRASLFYEMGYQFRSTVFVPMEFYDIFCPKLIEAVTWIERLLV